MPEVGGLKELPDIKALILYLLKEAGCVVTEAQLTDVLMADGLVEYFDYSQAAEQLLVSGLMDIASLEEPSSYRITRQGREVEAEYESRLPHNVKSKTGAAMNQVLRKQRENEQVWAKVEPTASGFEVTCTVQEQGEILLSYTVLVPDQRDAHYVAERFREHSVEYYQKIMELVLDENLFKKGED